jgi:hypothetical protein
MARSAATPSTPSRSLLSVSIISVVVGLGALFWTLFSWSSKVEPVSPAEVERHTLAAAQNYTSTMVLDDPLVVYLDDFLSLAEVDEILNIRWDNSEEACAVELHPPDHRCPLAFSRVVPSCLACLC